MWFVDTRRRLTALDLESGSFRAYAPGVVGAAVGPDGTAWAVDSANRVIRLSRRVLTVLPARLPPEETALVGAIAGQVVAVRRGAEPQAQLLSVERAAPPVPVRDGPVALTWWGELLAAADGETVRLYRVSDGTRLRDVNQPARPAGLVFSPSGHRLYALAGTRITVSDRFTGARLGMIHLPQPATALRGESSGRWLLAPTAGGDSVLVVDLVAQRHAATLPGTWRADLPLVAGAATVLAAEGADVVSYDLASDPPAPHGRLKGGAADRWTAIAWVPPHRADAVLAAEAAARATQDSALLPVAEASVPEGTIWLQVSSSQNPEWARELARQLADAGFETTVWDPFEDEEGYRVVVGPFRSRQAAEEAGQRLGRPYFIATRGAPPGR